MDGRPPEGALKAVYYHGGGRFSVGRCEPAAPGAGEVRLLVRYCGVCGTDVHIARGHMDKRIRPPQVIGHEMSGTVAEVGSGVTGLVAGDDVVVRPLDERGATAADRGITHISHNLRFLGIDAPGAFQASWTVPAETVHRLPEGTDLRLGALVEPLAVACHDVRRGRVVSGETAVVIGGGPIGILIALVASHLGADVLLAETDPYRRGFSAELGLDVVDPAGDDLAGRVLARGDGGGAHVVFEVSGSASGALAMTGIAGLRGRVVVVAIFPEPTPVRLFDLFWRELEVIGTRVYEPEDYERAIELVASRSLPLDRLITATEPLTALPGLLARQGDERRTIKTVIDCQV